MRKTRHFTDAERGRILDQALASAQRFVRPDAEVREVAKDLKARHLCTRFHGSDSEHYSKIAELMRHTPHGHQGRGRCFECKHQVFFDPGHPGMFPERKLCLHCMFQVAGQDASQLEVCPADPCPYGAIHEKEGT